MWGDGSWGYLWLAPLLMLACMLLMGRMMGHHGNVDVDDSEGSRQRRGPAERILAERLARGEIGTDEYERRLDALRAAGGSDRTAGAGHVE